MGSVTEEEGVLLYRVLSSSSSSSASSDEWNPTDTVIFFGLSLGLGIACRHVLRGTRVPYTVALLVIGIALGSLEYGTSHKLGRIGDGIRLWAHIDPDLLLAVFLPALLFESSFSMEVHQIKRCMAQMLLLAGPGVLISTCCLGCALKLIFPYNWSWTTSLLLGGLLSATDPVAVVALLKELGASKKLSTIIEGESLMNDGTAIVVYQLFYRMVLGESFNWVSILKFLTQVSLGAVGIGIAFGIASVLWLGFIFNDTVIEIALTLAVSYIAYFTEMVAYIANTLIFILSGVVIAEGVLSSGNIFHNHGHAWGYLLLLYIFVQLSRFVVVGVLYPFLRYFGYGLDWKEATILIWSGLRGAVALSLSLSVKASNDSSMYLSSETGTLFVFFTGGIVLLTLIVNGSTTQFILHLLDMDRISATKKRILNYTKYEMLNKALEAFGDLGDDEELGPVDWPSVKTYIASLNNLEGSFEHPYSASEAGNNLDPNTLKDIRLRLLNIGGSDIASIVINESEAEGEEARKFLEDVRVTFPQESAIVLAKLLLPQVFEKMPLQELRVLVAQRSVITTYIRGETIEVPHHSLGFLLEGFIKAHGFQELTASPAVLLPLQGNQSSQNIEISGSQAASSSHQGSRYQVEARARVIFFDIAAFEVDDALRRRSSSLASVDRPNRPLTREHGGLMSWPENFYRPRERKPNCEGTYRPANSLSARAMQLSIFGSMVDMRRRAHSFSSSQVKRSHSMSVLRMASFRNRQQVPVPSEGATSARMTLEVRNLIGKTPAPQLHSAGTNETHTMDNYSDESDAEDEIVVRIDSPSRLSFHQES
uniref:SOS1-like protein 1B n=1 Tax=Populus nigra TaxID=3691 RepID=A0A2L0W085_POPNI|nr:SOS1-like protein 1B [Populus nigra]